MTAARFLRVIKTARPTLQGAVRPALVVGGLCAFTAAAWTVTLGLGLFVGGCCALYLEFLLTPGDADRGAGSNTTTNR